MSDVIAGAPLGHRVSSVMPADNYTLLLTFTNGEQRVFDAYHIEGNNYFRLRDIADLMGFKVDWIESTLTVIITANPLLNENQESPDEEENAV